MSKKVITYCNICGKEFNSWDTQEDYSIHTCCGYGSKHDGCKLDLDICCDCMHDLIERCKINPLTEGYGIEISF